MARQLKCGPSDVTIIAVKPKDTGCGLELSPEIQRLIPRIIEEVFAEL